MSTKVLILDDKKEDREAITKCLGSYDCNVLEVEDGAKLMEVVHHEKPNLIMMDPNIGGGNGFELLQTLSTDGTSKTIPVMVLTAEAKRDKVMAAAKLGIKDYILKPMDPVQIAERISRIVDIPRRSKNIKDAAKILVVDDKPMIIEQVKSVAKGTPWEIVSTARTAEALHIATSQFPDIILVSLNLPNEEGFNLIRSIRADEKMRNIPIFGMCVTIAVDEQNRAQQVGATGIVTKPIDVDDLRQRLTRAMNLDTSQRYFEIRDHVLFVTFPADVDVMLNEIGSYIKPQTATMVVTGMSRLLIDLSQVSGMDTNVLRLLIQVISHCEELDVSYCVVGSAQTAAKAKLFEETKNMKIFENVEEALKSFGGEKKEPGDKPA